MGVRSTAAGGAAPPSPSLARSTVAGGAAPPSPGGSSGEAESTRSRSWSARCAYLSLPWWHKKNEEVCPSTFSAHHGSIPHPPSLVDPVEGHGGSSIYSRSDQEVHGFGELEPYGVGSGCVASAGLRSALAGGGSDDAAAW
jgi:hypothetical protein